MLKSINKDAIAEFGVQFAKREQLMKDIIVVIAAFLFLAPAAFGQETADFSGTWTLNKAASKLTDQFSMAPTQIKIIQSGNDLEVERTSSMLGNAATIKDKFTLDGKECINPGWSDSEKRSTAVWAVDKASLIITTKISMGDNGDMTIIETYRLRDKQFVIETKGSSSFGEVSETQVFDKK